MTSMNGMSGLGGKPIKVSVAVNKMKDGLAQPQVPDHLANQVAKGVVGSGYGYGNDDDGMVQTAGGGNSHFIQLYTVDGDGSAAQCLLGAPGLRES